VIRLVEGAEGRGLAVLFADLTATASAKLDAYLSTQA
jgi:hypothetical protein